MILPNDTTVAVADGAKLRLFRNKGVEPQIRLAALADPQINTANQGSGGRHRNLASNPDAGRLAEDNFAAAAAEYLNRQVLAGDIGPLFVVADARTLGEMRRHFHQALQAKLVGELAKDLTGHTAEAIVEALAKA